MDFRGGNQGLLQAGGGCTAIGRASTRIASTSVANNDIQTNCLSEIFFGEAVSIARSLDEHLQNTGRLVGPLHGLPISLKDNFNVIGKDSTVGFASLVGQPATYNATLVELLEQLGAVRYCKTNVPTAMMIVRTMEQFEIYTTG